MADLQLENTLSIRQNHWSNPGQTDYSEPLPEEVGKMGEKYDERPHRNIVHFAIGDRENPYNWSVVSLAYFVRVDVISNDTDIESPLRNAKFSYLSLVS